MHLLKVVLHLTLQVDYLIFCVYVRDHLKFKCACQVYNTKLGSQPWEYVLSVCNEEMVHEFSAIF